MTVQEWEKVFEMSQDKNLYHNLCTSLFPTIHGELWSAVWFFKLEGVAPTRSGVPARMRSVWNGSVRSGWSCRVFNQGVCSAPV